MIKRFGIIKLISIFTIPMRDKIVLKLEIEPQF